MISRFIEDLERFFKSEGALYRRRIEARVPCFEKPPEALDRRLVDALAAAGAPEFYRHQAEAVRQILAGKHTIVATPTASGKTLAYNAPVFDAILRDPSSKALYVFPIKALEQDQLKTVLELGGSLDIVPAGFAAVYDGDTPDQKRKKIRLSPPNIIVTNPDMVHRSILPFHDAWKEFFTGLKFVVLDELHNYRGVFGSHVAQVARRLRRMAAFYGASPTFIACSATISNPGQHAKALTGLDFSVVDRDSSPAAERNFLFVNPAVSAYTAASRIFVHAVKKGLKTIAFTKARKITELMYSWVVDELPAQKDRISSYRAGFLPEERREIEEALFSGRMAGVISTSALEMGIDIGALDVCILVGYPGTVINTWQRGGRVGRAGRESAVVLVAMQDALDQYFMRHPEDFFGRPFESAALDPYNPQILGPHLECAASERPLETQGDAFDLEAGREAVELMENQRRLLRSADGRKIFSARRKPHRFVDIRSIGEGFTILEKGTNRVIGSIGGARTFSECHEGAVYLHRGGKFIVTGIDLKKSNIFAEPTRCAYYTSALSEKETEIIDTISRRPEGNFILNYGKLKVTEKVVGFQKRNQNTQELLSVHELDLPPQTFETTGIWFEFPAGLGEAMENEGMHFMGGLHALEHAAISVFPLIALCDRFDLGGISTVLHEQTRTPAVFIYDGYPGGIGLCKRGFDAALDLLGRTLSLVSECPCEDGCPSCVHSPKCGSGNKPLDKRCAKAILEVMLNRRVLPVPAASAEPAGEGPEPAAGAAEAGEGGPFQGRRVVVFDVETRRSAEEVGGWQNANLMRVSVVVAWDSRGGVFSSFHEDEVPALVNLLSAADLVVGFNVKKFDYSVLSGYVPAAKLHALPTFDILEYIKDRYGFRIGLGKLGMHTLGRDKSADGLQALAWFKEGKMDLIEKYCRDDVEITKDLLLYGMEKGFILYERSGEVVRLPVEWDIEKIVRKP